VTFDGQPGAYISRNSYVEIIDEREDRQRTHNEQNLFDALRFPPRESITVGRGEKSVYYSISDPSI